ncbi:hypothetical protein CHU92_03665 [Flavobacterium cyanobacteriorum]|uniref:Cell shape-determining protein n=1 Tax=Flavobacterium cyanobacteriorum TaxID=2022802 RepID=A0A255ZP41_9FLAO|nr:hypothetical protein [Flavobacterium cyanobacteriorum]OYQ43169.1 hypothetical protein CHU92_03665 [Flavobacterium cyanobacteriorum]
MKNIYAVLSVLVIAFLFFYFGMPVINYGFIKLPLLLLLLLIFAAFLTIRWQTERNKTKAIFSPVHRILVYAMIVIVLYITIVPLVTTAPIFRSKAYRGLIGNVKNGTEMSNHIAPLSVNRVRVVDQELAHLLGEKIMGSEPALGSRTELGRFSIQKVNGELYWVAPLLHSGFFKWLNNREGTDGYVMVSATNERDVKLVQKVNGRQLSIKYQPNAFFGSFIERHLYFNGYAATGLDDYTFEIDDEGNPFWVVTKYKKEVGFAGDNATGVVVVDAATGNIKEYNIKDTPEWIDRIQPEEFISEQLDDWGEYVHGYFNFSNQDKLVTTEDLTLVYGEDNKSYWYTGVSSVGKDESAVGFILVDTRTKEATLYKQSGATEYAAQTSAEGKVQEKGYRASLPVPYTINNIPTYVMTLKDDAGLVKMYAMVAIGDYTIVGVGNTMQETLMSYKNVFNMSGNRINPNKQSDRTTLKTVVARIQSDIKNGNSFYYFTVNGNPKIFIGSSQISNELPVTAAGDSITISFDEDNGEVIDVSSFDNRSLGKR